MGKLLTFLFLIIILVSSSIGQTVSAIVYDKQFYESNNIIFFNPNDGDCTPVNGLINAKNVDYAGNQVLNSTQLGAIEQNKKFYESAANTTGVPWQLIATIHYRETGLKRYGPANGDGPYQIVGGEYRITSGSELYTDEEFQSATNDAAEFIKNKASGLILSDINNIKRTLFTYNGVASVYKEQAKSLGFSDTEANNGEGSPYVMNRADVQRDPTVEPTKSNSTWGQIKVDHGSIQYPANSDYGSFVIYSVIANVNPGGGCGGGQLSEGGMTLDEAKAFMDVYTNSSDSINYIGSADTGCSGGALSNCTSFSAYFVNKYTSLTVLQLPNRTGNGRQVVTNMISRNSDIELGSVPKPYAVFSTGDGQTYCDKEKRVLCGHTGIILGVDIENEKVIVGEASCSSKRKGGVAAEYSLSKFSDGSYRYAYIESFLKSPLTGGGE